jgi:hypothetical protein
MSGPKPSAVAILRSGWVAMPPIDREEAAAILGVQVPPEAWRGIKRAFVRFSDLTAVIAGPRVNNNRDDPRSYTVARDRAEADLECALMLIMGTLEKRDIVEAMTVASMRSPDGAETGGDLRDALKAASFAIRTAKRIVRRAVNPPVVVASEADARKRLARDILAVLADSGLPRDLTGWTEARNAEGLAEADMTPAERLISALGVHEAETPSAFVRWVRGACE